jgi:RNA polymerase sigma factor (sigma-70 family)
VDAPIDDRLAVTAARKGDREAFCTLVGRYQEVAFRAAYLVVRDAAAAEDIAQEGFVRAFQNLRSFREDEPFRPWLLRIVTNLALNDVRARGRRQGLLARFARVRQDPEPTPDHLVLAGERHDLLARAINELPKDDRVVLYLRYFLDLPEREIATAIDRPAGTVKSRLSRASGRLREVIEQRYPALRPEPVSSGEGRHV